MHGRHCRVPSFFSMTLAESVRSWSPRWQVDLTGSPPTGRSAGIPAAAAPAAPVPQGRACHLPGAEEGLRCLGVPVPLDYRVAAGPALTLHVALAPAFREAARPDPLFVLAGGPGEAGSDVLPLLSLRGSLEARNVAGGTAPAQVRAQIARHQARLA